MEFADDGDLEGKIKNKRNNKEHFEEKEIWNIFIQAIRGLSCLHEAQILHRDLKVFLNSNVILHSEQMYSYAKMAQSNLEI